MILYTQGTFDMSVVPPERQLYISQALNDNFYEKV